jgi:methionyl-tRNA formyltransferase
MGATYAGKLHKDEASLDWSRPAVELDRQVRAFNPWPVAATTLAGEPVRIWQAQPSPGEVSPALAPGTVVTATGGRIIVATGAGLLELQALQFPGRKPLAARDVLNSRSLAGARFGAALA